MKVFKIIFCLSLLILVFCACGKKDTASTTENSTPVPTTESTTQPESTIADTSKATVKNTKPATNAPETTTRAAKYGDSALSTDTDNKFVKAVVDKYGIETEGLVTTYSTIGGNGNYVFQFDGSRDSNGNLIRTGSTLKYVYSVSADCSTVCRTGGYSGNDGLSFKDGLTIFLLAQKVLIPQFEDQLNA